MDEILLLCVESDDPFLHRHTIRGQKEKVKQQQNTFCPSIDIHPEKENPVHNHQKTEDAKEII